MALYVLVYLKSFVKFKTIIVKITVEQYQIMWCAYCVFVCALFPVQGGMWTEFGLSGWVFVIFSSTKREIVSLTCCLVINTFCWWYVCIYSASQQIMHVPFWHAFNNCSVLSLSYIYACSQIWVLHMRMLNCCPYITYMFFISYVYCPTWLSDIQSIT